MTERGPSGGWLQRLDKVLFFVLLGCVVTTYLTISRERRTYRFWNWRKTFMPTFLVTRAEQDWGNLAKDQDLEGGPMVVDGKVYASGLATHANSAIHIKLDDDYKFFTGGCGYPDNRQGAVIYCQIADGEEVLYTSPLLNERHHLERFAIELRGRKSLTLLFRSGADHINSAHAFWLTPRGTDEQTP